MLNSSSSTASSDSFKGAVRHIHTPHSGALVQHRHGPASSVAADQGSAAGSPTENADTAADQDRGGKLQSATKAIFEIATRDLRELSSAHDRQNRQEFNSDRGIPLESDEQVNLQSLKDDLIEIRQELANLDGLGPQLTKRFEKHITTAENALNALDANSQRNPKNVLNVAAFTVLNTALMSLPWLLATDPLRVKDVEGGESRLSKDFMIIMAGYQAKTVALLLSHLGSEVSNTDTFKGFAKERHSYELQSFATGAPAVFSKSVHDAVQGSTGYVMGRAAVSATALNLLFQTDELGRLGNRVATGMRSLVTTGSLKNSTAYPRLEAQSAHLQEPQKQTLNDVADRLTGISKKLKEVNEQFTDADRQPSIAWEEHVTNARRALTTAATEINISTRAEATPQENTDKTRKIMLAGVGALVTVGLLVSVLNDELAVADILGDAMFSMPILLVNAFDPNVTAKGAKDAFKSFMGTSLISAVVLGANTAAGDPIAKNDNLFFAMMPIFAGLALTMPSPAADGLVNVLEKLYACVGGTTTRHAEHDAPEDNFEMMSVVQEIDPSEEMEDRVRDLEAQEISEHGLWPLSGEAAHPESLSFRPEGTTVGDIPEISVADMQAASTEEQKQEFVEAGVELLTNTLNDENVSMEAVSMAVGNAFHALLEPQEGPADERSTATDNAASIATTPLNTERQSDNAAQDIRDRLDQLDQDLARIAADRADRAAAAEAQQADPDDGGPTPLPG